MTWHARDFVKLQILKRRVTNKLFMLEGSENIAKHLGINSTEHGKIFSPMEKYTAAFYLTYSKVVIIHNTSLCLL
jgi:hypothetical protein